MNNRLLWFIYVAVLAIAIALACQPQEKIAEERIRIIEIQSGRSTIIQLLGPEESYRILGAHINVAGSFGVKINYLTTKTRDWAYKIKKVH